MKKQELIRKMRVCEITKNFKCVIDDTIDNNNSRKFLNRLLLGTYTTYLYKRKTKTKVVGYENIVKIDKAFVSINNVYEYQHLLIKRSLKPHKPLIFNFDLRKKALDSFNLEEKVLDALDNNRYIVFYPEGGMWPLYEKPRPHNNQCYEYSYNYNIPIVNAFITFKETNKMDKECLFKKEFVINYLKPVYPDLTLDITESINKMKEESKEIINKAYEEFYKKKLEYEI